MKTPWLTDRAEVRAVDLPVKSKEEFENYLRKYSGRGLRFIDPQVGIISWLRMPKYASLRN